jgi:hypothetical protein
MRKMESDAKNAAKYRATSKAECKAGEREQRAAWQSAQTGPELLEARSHGEPDSRRVRRGEERPRGRDRRRRRDAYPPARQGSRTCGRCRVRPVLGKAAKRKLLRARQRSRGSGRRPKTETSGRTVYGRREHTFPLHDLPTTPTPGRSFEHAAKCSPGGAKAGGVEARKTGAHHLEDVELEPPGTNSPPVCTCRPTPSIPSPVSMPA